MPFRHPKWDPDNLPPDNLDWDGISSIADIFTGGHIYRYPSFFKNLYCYPAFASILEDAQHIHKADVEERIVDRLKKFTQLLASKEENIYDFDEKVDYDFVMIDTSPRIGPLTTASIRASSHVIIPADLEEFGTKAIEGMLFTVACEKQLRSKDDPIEIAGIIPNKVVRRVPHHKSIFKKLRSINGSENWLLPPVIERGIYGALAMESRAPKSVFDLPPSHPARKESELWCSIVYERVFNKKVIDCSEILDNFFATRGVTTP